MQPHGVLPAGATIATPGRRLVARILDGVIVALPLSVVVFLLWSSSPRSATDLSQMQSGIQASSLLVTVLILLYEAVFIRSYGATLGKMIMKIRVVTEHSGVFPDWGSSFLRVAIPTAAGFAPGVGGLLVLVVYASLLFDTHRRSWYDKAARTLVINHTPNHFQPSGLRPPSPLR